MENEYKISRYSSIDIKKLKLLYTASYGRKRSLKYFRYRLDENPFGKAIAYVMKYNDILVGFYAITPIKLNIDQKSTLGGYSFLSMTHPDHSKKGIFQKLAKKTFEEAKKQKYNFILGFANKTSFPIFTKKLNFKHVFPLNHLEIKIDPNPSFSLKMSKTNRYPDKLWNNYNSKNELISIEKNNNYLYWRFINPLYQYYIFSSKNEYFVYKKFDNTLHILDFFGTESEQFYENLLDVANVLLKKLDCEKITLWIPKNHNLLKSSKIIKKKKLHTDSFFIIKILNKKISSNVSKIDNWYYSMSDSDVF
jgi:hypothetical protein